MRMGMSTAPMTASSSMKMQHIFYHIFSFTFLEDLWSTLASTSFFSAFTVKSPAWLMVFSMLSSCYPVRATSSANSWIISKHSCMFYVLQFLPSPAVGYLCTCRWCPIQRSPAPLTARLRVWLSTYLALCRGSPWCPPPLLKRCCPLGSHSPAFWCCPSPRWRISPELLWTRWWPCSPSE